MNFCAGGRVIVPGSVVLSIFMMVLVTGFLYYHPIGLAAGVLCMLILVLSESHHLFEKHLSPARIVALVLVIVMTLSWPFALYKTPVSIYHYAVGSLAVVSAFVASRNPVRSCASIKTTLVILQAYTVFHILRSSGDVLPLDNMFGQASSNGITAVMILLQVAYSGSLFHTRKRVALITPWVTLYICIMGFSRASILAALMIIMVSAVYSIITVRSPVKRLSFLAFGITALIFCAFKYYDDFSVYMMTNTKLGQGLVDQARLEMLEDYYSKINVITIVTGAEFVGTSIESKYNGNPHSSFIWAHHLFGGAYLVVLLVTVVAIFINAVFRNAPGFIVILCMVALLRAITEPILFPTAMDFFIFLYFFIVLGPREREQLPLARGWC